MHQSGSDLHPGAPKKITVLTYGVRQSLEYQFHLPFVEQCRSSPLLPFFSLRGFKGRHERNSPRSTRISIDFVLVSFGANLHPCLLRRGMKSCTFQAATTHLRRIWLRQKKGRVSSTSSMTQRCRFHTHFFRLVRSTLHRVAAHTL